MTSSIQKLKNAKRNKDDEFYTCMSDIKDELSNYKDYFKDKVVYCNCDNPYKSNFFKYFVLHFNEFGLKSLKSTCYSPGIQNYNYLKLFDIKDFDNESEISNNDNPYYITVNKVIDGQYSINELLKIDENSLSIISNGNGDFRSKFCIELLKQSDIIITNPPFSLFREYVDQLMEYNKKFIIIGNLNAIAYKQISHYIIDGRMNFGYNKHGSVTYLIPDEYIRDGGTYTVDDNGNHYVSLAFSRWYTNFKINKKYDELLLTKQYSSDKYSTYDNYDAINVDKTSDIPYDYDGIIGVPISFMDKYNPEQFELCGCACQDYIQSKVFYNDYVEMTQDGIPTGDNGSKINNNPVLVKNDGIHNYYINKDGRIVQTAYMRIFIRNRHPKISKTGENQNE